MEAQKDVADKGAPCGWALKFATSNPIHLTRLWKRSIERTPTGTRFEFNDQYQESFEAASLIVSMPLEDNDLVEMVEIKRHRFYIACQFHPEFKCNQ